MIKHLKHLVLLAFMAVASTAFAQYEWHKTTAPDFRGKQDDIYFVDEDKGWYVNGTGKIYKTVNGGQDWQLIFEKPGTFFRCIGFIDSLRGFVGNIGTDYFPNVADTVPLYKTTDGGKTWEAVQYKGPVVKGLCAIDILKVPFVNHGVLDYKYYINAGGRVGSPAYLMRSYDNGKTFTSEDVNAHCAFILDIKFLNEQEGFIMAGSDNVLTKS
ncbi:MAG: hypothetical protein H0U44_08020, partial [Flavisolibacter sp.]|nr:hypothetical protein [Flavisolibacter sp.]